MEKENISRRDFLKRIGVASVTTAGLTSCVDGTRDAFTRKAGNTSADNMTFRTNPKSGEKVLILRAENGSPELTRILADNNIDFDDVKTYDIQLEKKQDNSVVDTDFITFASASGVNTFFDGGAIISDRTSVVCIGEITAEALESHGVNSFRIAKTKDTDGILKTIIKEVTLKEG